MADANNVPVNINSSDEFVNIIDSTQFYRLVPAGGTRSLNDGYSIEVDPSNPDLHNVFFSVNATDGASAWQSNLSLTAHSPVFALGNCTSIRSGGNSNGSFDPGETAMF